MTATTLPHPLQPLSGWIKSGSSPTARSLEKKSENIIYHYEKRSEQDFRFRIDLERAFSELALAIEIGERDNWNHYGAAKIDRRVCELAYQFLNALPSSIPVPEVGLDPDGEISFEWIVARDMQFSVSLSPEGLLSYAGVFGDHATTHGTEKLDETVPQTIIASIRRLGIGR